MAGWLLALAGAVACVWQGRLAINDLSTLQGQREGLAGLRRSAASMGTMSAEERARHAQIETVARSLAQPATQVLDVIESHDVRGTTLFRVSHDVASGAVELEGTASSAAAREAFVEALSQDRHLRAVQVRTLPGGTGGRWQVSAVWVAAW